MRNIEALRNYFLGKDPQLKETMADNSLRLCGIQGKFYVLRTELIAKLKELKDYVDEQDKDLQDEIDDLIADVSNLKTWKETTDFVLEDDLAQALSNYYDKSEVDQLISVIPRFDIEVVASLPTHDISETTIYLVPSTNPETANSYDEFIYVSNNWEQIGSTAIDLSNYYTKGQVNTLFNQKTFTTTLTQDITIDKSNPVITGLSGTGWYFTGSHNVNYDNGESTSTIAYANTLFYYWEDPDLAGDNSLWFLPTTLDGGNELIYLSLYYDLTNNEWTFSGYDITQQINSSSNDLQVPTAGAVYTAINSRTFVNVLTADLTLPQYSHTVAITAEGWYYTDTHKVYLQNTVDPIANEHTLFYFSGADGYVVDGMRPFFYFLPPTMGSKWRPSDVNNPQYHLDVWLFWDDEAGTWAYQGHTIVRHIQPGVGTGEKDIPTIEAVDELFNLKQTKLATDLTADVTLVDGTAPSLSDGVYYTNGYSVYINGVKDTRFENSIFELVDDGTGAEYFTRLYPSTDKIAIIIYNEDLLSDEYTTETKELVNKDETFSGTDGIGDGEAGLVPAPLTTDAGNFLCADGTWQPAGGGGTTITYGTTDLTPGVSPLNEGEFYFVYE